MKKHLEFRKFFGFFLILFLAGSLSAKSTFYKKYDYAKADCDYYVAQNSAGSGNGSSYNNRMSVANHNAGTFSPGDVICLVDEISSQVVIPSSGNSTNRITYRGDYEGHKGVLTAIASGALRGDYKTDLNIDNIEVRDGKIGIGFINGCHNITITNCEVHDMARAGSKGIWFSSNTIPITTNTNIIIGGSEENGNEVYDCGTDTGGNDVILAHTDGMLVSYNKLYGGKTNTGIDGICFESSTNGIIEYNEIFDHIKSNTLPSTDLGEDGIDLKGSVNIVVRYNHIYGNRQAGVMMGDSGSGNYCENNSVYGNRIHHNRTNIGIAYLIRDAFVYNNLLYNTTSVHGISCSTDGDNVQIYNNTIVNCHGTGNRFALLFGQGTNYIAKNNIFYSDTHNDLVYVAKPSEVTLDNNRYYYTGGDARISWDGVYEKLVGIKSLGQEANGSEGSPGLTNIAANDFTLAAGSACINTGINLGSDYANALAPYNTNFSTFPPTVKTANQNSYDAWEIGAFVYGDAPTATAIDPEFGIEFKVYPNPFNDRIFIDNNDKLTRVVVSNIVGQRVIDNEYPNHEIRTGNLVSGMYLVRMYSDNVVVKTSKIIK